MDNNFQPQHHEMLLQETFPSGQELWFCPVCGRRFLLEWPPKYKKVILEVGDEYAIHTGGKADTPVSLLPAPQEQPDPEKKPILKPILSDDDRRRLKEMEEILDAMGSKLNGA